MNVASRELCEELYKLSGWWSGELTDLGIPDCWWNWLQDVDGGNVRCVEIATSKSNCHWKHRAPAYELSYLLRKMGDNVELKHFGVNWDIQKYHGDSFTTSVADIPEDATAHLAIALFKTGILKREV